MKLSPWIFTLALAVLFSVSGTFVYAQDAAVKAFEEGTEDLQNNLVGDAITKLEAGLAAGQSGSNPLPDTDELIVKIRYAYAYALARERRFFDAIPELDVLVESAPEMEEAKYLLAVTLIRSMSNENVMRGMGLLKRMADESTVSSGRTIAMNTAAQLGFNVSTAEYAAGDPEAAAQLLNGLRRDYGQALGKDKAENQNIRFAVGVYLRDAGDLDGALYELDILAGAGEAQDYALKSGTTLSQVRADVYYQTALARLEEGGETGGREALDLIKQLEILEGTDGPDANFNTHARALAYSLTGDSEASKMEMDKLKASNEAYFNSVTN